MSPDGGAAGDGDPGPQDDPAGGVNDGEGPGPRSEPGWARLIAPLRSEDAAFRTVVWAAAIAVTLAVIVVLVRLVGG